MNDREIRHALRSDRAGVDLAACATWAAGVGLHLLLEQHVASRFTFADTQLPPATVDARDGDALAIAIAEPTALLITAGGHYWGTPLTGHPDWPAFDALPRTWGVLGVSALTGTYYGLHVHGAHEECFVGGVREETVGIEATIELVDASVATALRTTIGVRLEHGDRFVLCRDLGKAFNTIRRPVARVDAPAYETATLAALIEQAAVLPDDALVLNGETWHRTPALKLHSSDGNADPVA